MGESFSWSVSFSSLMPSGTWKHDFLGVTKSYPPQEKVFESISSWRTHCLSLSHSIRYLTLLENCDLFPDCIYVNHHLIFFPFHLKALTVSKLYFLSMKVLKPHSFLIYTLCTFFSASFHSLFPKSLSSYCQEKENIWLMIFLVLKFKRVQVTRYHQQFKNFVFSLPPSNPFLWLTS